MERIKTYRDLNVWKKSMNLVTEVYKTTNMFPRDEMYGLTSQIRRSAVSIPSNIAEGYGRNSTDDYIRFLQISLGSLYETQTQVEISNNLNYLNHEKFHNLHESMREIERMLTALIFKIRKS